MRMKLWISLVLVNFNHPVVPLLGRLLMTYIYLTSGFAKIVDWRGNVAYMDRHHLPMIPVLLATAAFVELAGSLCLVTGYQARWAAFVMFGYTTVMTILLHNYWAYTDRKSTRLNSSHIPLSRMPSS